MAKSNVNSRFKIYSFFVVSISLMLFFLSPAYAATGREKIIFLHHSTGNYLYQEGNVAAWFKEHNARNGTSYQLDERMYPQTPVYPAWDNYPYDYWNLWINGACSKTNSATECLDSLAQKYDVIIFKHCYPGSAILADTGNPSVSSKRKSLENYKLQYRALRDLMDAYPLKKFIIWTLSPTPRFVAGANSESAARAKEFVEWVKNDFLKEDGKNHPNIYIFDWWGIAAGTDNFLKQEYERPGQSDPHPNAVVNKYAGPIFAQTIIDVINNGYDVEGDKNSEDNNEGQQNAGNENGGENIQNEEKIDNFASKENENEEIANIDNNAKKILENKFDDILIEIKALRNITKERQNKIKYLNKLMSGVKLTSKMEQGINEFITYGVDENTQKLGEGERAAVMYSYKVAFNKLPQTEDELADVIKIANGRWPSSTNSAAEKRAKERFREIYKKIADMHNLKDNAAITIMAYGLRQKAENRNLKSEQQGIKIFKGIYKKNPETTDEWNILQAITYSGAIREKDTDSDFLPDEREKALGTDANNPDTDGDGYVDGIEVENNYDPIKEPGGEKISSSESIPKAEKKWHPGHYMLQDKTWTVAKLDEEASKLDGYVKGIQIGAWWRDLEPQKDVYDFSRIKEILAVAKKYKKQLFVQVMDRIFATTGRPIPDYLYDYPAYSGGAAPFTGSVGSIAKFWEPPVGERFNLLVKALGKEFDTDPYFEGINFDESTLPLNAAAVAGYSDQKLLDAMELRIDNAVESFPHSVVIQYMNYYPQNIVGLYEYIYKAGAGIGGPDLVPDEGRFPEKPRIPAYDFYPKYAGKMPLGTAVQSEEFLDPEWLDQFCAAHADMNVNLCQKVNGNYLRKKGNFTLDSFFEMGLNTLKLNYIFWEVVEGENYKYSWEKDVKPFITEKKGKINEACPENYSGADLQKN